MAKPSPEALRRAEENKILGVVQSIRGLEGVDDVEMRPKWRHGRLVAFQVTVSIDVSDLRALWPANGTGTALVTGT